MHGLPVSCLLTIVMLNYFQQNLNVTCINIHCIFSHWFNACCSTHSQCSTRNPSSLTIYISTTCIQVLRRLVCHFHNYHVLSDASDNTAPSVWKIISLTLCLIAVWEAPFGMNINGWSCIVGPQPYDNAHPTPTHEVAMRNTSLDAITIVVDQHQIPSLFNILRLVKKWPPFCRRHVEMHFL